MLVDKAVAFPYLSGNHAHLSEEKLAASDGHDHYDDYYPHKVRGEVHKEDGRCDELADGHYYFRNLRADKLRDDSHVFDETVESVSAVTGFTAVPLAPEHIVEVFVSQVVLTLQRH